MSNKKEIIWLAISIIGAIVILISYFLIADQSTSYDGGNARTSAMMGSLAFGAGIVSIFIFIACFKIKKWWKIIPVLCLIICILVACLAFFTSSFLSGPSFTF
jgi:cell division protein FtsW (lipid II flippase)